MNPTALAVLADVIARHGGSWMGPVTKLQEAMRDVAGPDRIRHVPITAQRLSRLLGKLATDGQDEGLALHAARLSFHTWLLSAGH